MLLFCVVVHHDEEFDGSGADSSDTESTESDSVAFVGQNDQSEVQDGTLLFEKDLNGNVVLPSTMATNAGGFGQHETACADTPPCPPLQNSNFQPSMTNLHGMLTEPSPWNPGSVQQQQQLCHQPQVVPHLRSQPSQNSSTKSLMRSSEHKKRSKKKKKKTPETPPAPRPESDRTVFASLHNQRSNIDSIMTKRTDTIAGKKRAHDDGSDSENEPPQKVTHVQIGATKIKLGKSVGVPTQQLVQIANIASKFLGEKKELAQHNKELLKEKCELAKSGSKGPKNEGVCKQIHDACFQTIFRLKKFVQTESDEMKATRAVHDVLHPLEDDEVVDEEAKKLWCQSYCGEVTDKVNCVRSCKQQRMKEAAMACHKEHKHLPSLEMLEKCALRQIDFKNDDEVVVFKWCWDVLCSKC